MTFGVYFQGLLFADIRGLFFRVFCLIGSMLQHRALHKNRFLLACDRSRCLLLFFIWTLIILMAQSWISICYITLQPCPRTDIDNLAKHIKILQMFEPFIRIWKRYLHHSLQFRGKPTSCATLAGYFFMSSRTSWTTQEDHLYLGTCRTCPKPFTKLCLTCSPLPWSLWRIVVKTTSNWEFESRSFTPQLQQRKSTPFWSLLFNSCTVLAHQHNDKQATYWSNGYGNTTMMLLATLKTNMRYSRSTTFVDRPVHQSTNRCFATFVSWAA